MKKMGVETNGKIELGPKKYVFDSNGVLVLIKERKKIGLRQRVDQNLAKKTWV